MTTLRLLAVACLACWAWWLYVVLWRRPNR